MLNNKYRSACQDIGAKLVNCRFRLGNFVAALTQARAAACKYKVQLGQPKLCNHCHLASLACGAAMRCRAKDHGTVLCQSYIIKLFGEPSVPNANYIAHIKAGPGFSQQLCLEQRGIAFYSLNHMTDRLLISMASWAKQTWTLAVHVHSWQSIELDWQSIIGQQLSFKCHTTSLNILSLDCLAVQQSGNYTSVWLLWQQQAFNEELQYYMQMQLPGTTLACRPPDQQSKASL